MTTNIFTPITTPGSQRIDLGDSITVWVVDGRVSRWADGLPNHRDATLKRCAYRFSRRRDAQRAYAKHLSDLVHDVMRRECESVPAEMARDLGEVLEAIAIDEARRIEVRSRALATVSPSLASVPGAGGRGK